MRRVGLVVLVVCATLLGVAASAWAADVAPPADDPTLLPGRFAAAVERHERGGACALLVADLRVRVFANNPGSVEVLEAAAWTPAAVTRGCDKALTMSVNGTRDQSGRSHVRRVSLGPVEVIARAGDAAHLRVLVHARHVHRPHDFDRVEDVFAEFEDGAWRLAFFGELLDPGLAEELLGEPREPTLELEAPNEVAGPTLDEFQTYRRELRRKADAVRAEAEAGVRAYGEARTTLGAEPLACSGPRSHRADAPEARAAVAPTQPAPVESSPLPPTVPPVPPPAGADIVSATLNSGGGRLCWTVRLRGRSELRARGGHVTVVFGQRGPGGRWRTDALDVVVRRGGAARAWLEWPGWMPVPHPRIVATARTVQVSAPIASLGGGIDFARPFVWWLTVTRHGRGGGEDRVGTGAVQRPAGGVSHRP